MESFLKKDVDMSLKRLLAGVFGSMAIAGSSMFAQDASLYTELEPTTIFSGGVQYLVMRRDSQLSTTTPVIDGPDSASVAFQNTDFRYRSGIRGFLAAETAGARIEAIYSDYGVWASQQQGTLSSGLVFDDGLSGPWSGANSLNTSTFFTAIAAAATPILLPVPASGGESDEFEGLGSVVGFPDDVLTYKTWYNSRLQTIEFNLLTADPASAFQGGIGYSHVQLNETAGVQIDGAFRAIDVNNPNGGLSDGSLIDIGGLVFVGGVQDGFGDETKNLSGLPDTLTLLNVAQTSNNLNGMQGVLRQEIMYYRGIVVDGVLKAGLYHNSTEGSILETYTGVDPVPSGATSSYQRLFSDSKSRTAYVGSVGLQSNIPLSNYWSLMSGYEATVIHGVALGPDQNLGDNGTTYTINTSGTVLVHGCNFGLQFVY